MHALDDDLNTPQALAALFDLNKAVNTLLNSGQEVRRATLAAIEAAEQATLKTAARYLEERMGPVISTITDGRYDEVEVADAETGEYTIATDGNEYAGRYIYNRIVALETSGATSPGNSSANFLGSVAPGTGGAQ